MTNLLTNDRNALKSKSIRLTNDDGVWLYETGEAQDLIALIDNPYQWVAKILVTPATGGEPVPAQLSDNFVISIKVSTSTAPDIKHAAKYVIDGIDQTGFISVKMSSVGQRFQFKSGLPFPEIAKQIIAQTTRYAYGQVGERAFIHVDLGTNPLFRRAILCAAIENQEWLCDLYSQLHLKFSQSENCSKRKVTFLTQPAECGEHSLGEAPTMDIIFQGTRSNFMTAIPEGESSSTPTLRIEDAVPAPSSGGTGSSSAASTLEDCCNVGSGTVDGETVIVDSVVIKAYA